MRIVADTNLLVRSLTLDDPRQAQRAQDALRNADLVAVTIPALCELVWVLSRRYGFGHLEIADAISRLINTANVVTDLSSAEAGLIVLQSGGDFADGAIAYEGRRLGADVFLSFDQEAVQILKAQGESARLV